MIGKVWRNLRSGYRLAVRRPAVVGDFSISVGQVIVLNLLGLSLAIGLQYLVVGTPAMFNSWALLRDGSVTLMFLLAAWFAVLAAGRAERWLTLVLLLSSIGPLFALLFQAAALLAEAGVAPVGWASLALLAWYLYACWRTLALVLETGAWRRVRSLVLLFAVAMAPFFLVPELDYWYAEDDELADESQSINVEDVFYSQWDLLETTLAELRPQRPGVVDLYHIGFGAYAWQKVFLREVQHVRDLLDERFDTRGRSITLVNHEESVGRIPIASGSNLAWLLRAVASRMDVDEDVLFLYLTSHGSKDAELVVDFWPLELNQVTADSLRRMLDDSGIRWRVIVISACYSGSFMERLQGPGTLVITAAARDRTSFGCSNENEYTYFGEAYFKHGLAQTHSFTAAFDLARNWIREREQAEALEPSRPMMRIGDALQEHLQALEERLDALAPPVAATGTIDLPGGRPPPAGG